MNSKVFIFLRNFPVVGGKIHTHTYTQTHTLAEIFQKDTTLILLCDLKQIHEKLKITIKRQVDHGLKDDAACLGHGDTAECEMTLRE